MPTRKPTKAAKKQQPKDAFETVARRLGCDPNLAAFDAKLEKIAKAKPSGRKGK